MTAYTHSSYTRYIHTLQQVKQTPIRTRRLEPQRLQAVCSIHIQYTQDTVKAPAIVFLQHDIKQLPWHNMNKSFAWVKNRPWMAASFLDVGQTFLHNTMEGERKAKKHQALEKWGTLAPGGTTRVFGMWRRYSTADGGLQEIQYCIRERWFRTAIMLANSLGLSLSLPFSSFSSRSSDARACTRSTGCTERLKAAEEMSPPRWCSYPPGCLPPKN